MQYSYLGLTSLASGHHNVGTNRKYNEPTMPRQQNVTLVSQSIKPLNVPFMSTPIRKKYARLREWRHRKPKKVKRKPSPWTQETRPFRPWLWASLACLCSAWRTWSLQPFASVFERPGVSKRRGTRPERGYHTMLLWSCCAVILMELEYVLL